MLTLLSSRNGTACDGTNRRDFLKVGALGLGGLTLPGLLKARAEATKAGKPTRNTSVVWLWLGGGPTHVETFNPNMSAPAEYRSVTGSANANLPGAIKGLDSFEAQALDLVVSKAKEVFDIKAEDQKTRDRYGKGLGEQMLLARRLVESGVGFVTLNFGGWDMHGQIQTAMKRLGPLADNAVSAFVENLHARSLNDDVISALNGRFG